MNNLDREGITKCPICKGELYSYSIMGLTRTELCFCPKCNIVRWTLMSIPFLCDKCYSRSFYEKDGKQICWFCGNDKIVGIKIEEAEKRGLFETEGFKLSSMSTDRKNTGCRHEHTENIRHNDEIFKFSCKDCGDIEYIAIPKWLQEERKIGDKI